MRGGGRDELSTTLTASGDSSDHKVLLFRCGNSRSGGGGGGGEGGREGERRLGDIGGGGGGLGRGDGGRAKRAVDGESVESFVGAGSFTSPSANCLNAAPMALRAMT
jgi:hypothetical protein